MELSPTVLTQDAIKNQEWNMLLSKASPERRAIFETLETRQWFQNTDHDLKKTLLTLPSKGIANCDGFLQDLAKRPEDIANIHVERLIDIPRGNYTLVPTFEVYRKEHPDHRFTYEYVSRNMGPITGAKGVVFVEKEGKTSHFILLQGEKFATGTNVFDSVGGFHEKDADGIKTMEDTIRKEIKEELGNADITVQNINRLGVTHPDVGLTNETPELFTATIPYEQMRSLSSLPVNPDIEELRSGIAIYSIDALPSVVLTNSDGFFLSTIARAWAKGIIPPPQGVVGTSIGFSSN